MPYSALYPLSLPHTQGCKFRLTVGGDNIHKNFSRAVFEGDTNNTAKIVLVRMYTQRKATTISVAGRLRRYFNDKCRELITVARKHTNVCLG